MKKALTAVTLAAAAALALPVWAEETRIPAGVFTNIQTQDQYLAKDSLIGAKVHGPDGKIIGDIEDLIVNDYNQIVGVVMGTGGFLGIGEKKVGVNLSALKFDEEGGKITVALPEATPEVLSAAEAYQRAQPKKSLLERAKEKAQELSDKSKATAGPAIEQAKEKAKEITERAKEAVGAAKESAAPAIDAAKQAIEDAKVKAQEAADKAAAAAGPAMDAAKEAVGKGMDKAREAIDDAKAAAGEAIEKAKEAAAPAPAEPAPAPAAPAPAEPAPAPAESAPQQ